MCTVTFVPLTENEFVLTSNRDEAPDRMTIPPEIYSINETKVLFPKDKNAGGTWIGASEKNRVLCLLNGGFEYHKRLDKYRASRGIIVRDLLVCQNFAEAVNGVDLTNIEPFTLVIVDWNDSLKCFELVWDGSDKHFKELPNEPIIWSSSTLYTEAMKEERKSWFETFKTKSVLTSETLLKFHNTAGTENENYGVVMDRGFVKTTSITQIKKLGQNVMMNFQDLNNQSTFSETLNTMQEINE